MLKLIYNYLKIIFENVIDQNNPLKLYSLLDVLETKIEAIFFPQVLYPLQSSWIFGNSKLCPSLFNQKWKKYFKWNLF